MHAVSDVNNNSKVNVEWKYENLDKMTVWQSYDYEDNNNDYVT